MTRKADLKGTAPDRLFVVETDNTYRIYAHEGRAVKWWGDQLSDGHGSTIHYYNKSKETRDEQS